MALTTLVGAAAGFAVAASNPPVYESTVRVDVGGPSQVEMITRLRLLVDDQAVAAHVIKDGGLDRPPFSLTPPRLSSAVSLRTGPDIVVLAVRANDPRLAEQAAGGFARRATQIVREQVAQKRDKVEKEVAVARQAVLDFMRQTSLEQRRFKRELVADQRRELASVHALISGERARIRLTGESATSRGEIAALEARRDYLIAAARENPDKDLAAVSEDELAEAGLRSALRREELLRDRILDGLPVLEGQPRLLDENPREGVRVDRGSAYYVTAGVGIGLMLACLGVMVFLTPVRS